MRGTPFLFNGFIAGLNTIDSPYTLEPTESPDCLNVVATTRGAIRKRNGSTVLTGAAPAVELHSIHPVTISGSTYLLAAGGGKLYSIATNGTVTQIGSGFNATARWSVVQAPTSVDVEGQGPVYLSNGTDAAQYWTGAGEVKAWKGKEDSEHYATSPYVPKGQWMIFAGNRIWMTGISSDPSAVWFSDIVSTGESGGQGDPSSWPKTNVVRFDASDGQAITGIGTIGPYIVVFKERKTWIITDLNTGANRRLADTIGCVSHRSIVETAIGTFFLTADQGVYLTDGSHLKEMSYSVRPTILGVTASQRQNAAGAYFNNHYYLSFPSGGSTTSNRTLDYDVQLKSWWLHDLAGNEWAVWEPSGETSLYTCTPGVSKGVVQAFVPGIYTDAGSNYKGANGLSAYWLSAWQPFWIFINRHRIAVPNIKKRIRQIHFDGSGEIIPIIGRDFATLGTYVPGVVGNESEDFPTTLVDFNEGEPVFGNEKEAQKFGAESLEGQQMIFGGAASTRDARLYSLGTGRAWQVGFGNNTSAPFEIDSFTFAITFRKS
jgi:hypothetical protein